MHPFRFAATMPAPAPPLADWHAELRHLEDLGLSSVVAADHFTGGYTFEPMVALTAAAAATTRLRLQTGVLGNDYRHPVLVHRMAALLDVVSDGRLVLGLGAGWMTLRLRGGRDRTRPGRRAGEPPRGSADRDQGPLRPRAVRLHRRALRRPRARRAPEAGATPPPPALRRRREPARPAARGPRGRHRRASTPASAPASWARTRYATCRSSGSPRRSAGRVRGAVAAGRDPDSLELEMNHWLARGHAQRTLPPTTC